MSSSLTNVLERLTKDKLKGYASALTSDRQPHVKIDIAAMIQVELKNRLNTLWTSLSDEDRLAVEETFYSPAGILDELAFQAKYGKLPDALGWNGWGYREKPPLLRLFLYKNEYDNFIIPEEIRERLKPLVSKPVSFRLQASSETPRFFEQLEKKYKWQADDEGITVITRSGIYSLPRKRPNVEVRSTQIPIVVREMELAAQRDLQTVLRLTAKGKILVSDKTSRVSVAASKEIAALLYEGDFYEIKERENKWQQEIGPLKAFAWPLLLQSAGLTEINGKKLALTKAGLQALRAPSFATLHTIWQKWLKSSIFDEFQRIETVKGQGGKGSSSMTAPVSRRTVIAAALKRCPQRQWIKVDDFFQFMQAEGFRFQVTREDEPWSLYISDPRHGSLGYNGFHEWTILQGRYILAFLFEYAATLGLIDVGFISPDGARHDYRDYWGTDDLSFFSRYDGLIYFRLNPFGDYCLGLSDNYNDRHSILATERATVSVSPHLRIAVTNGSLTPESEMLLDTFADEEPGGVWRLSRNKTLAALENGHQMDELRQFLQTHDEQPLPEPVEAFINTNKKTRQGSTSRRNGAID